ncbi:hypothetical protein YASMINEVIRUS_379 [Yasminevirus sp. GU-2018]|uniref:Uncharacterized protein n=1 Tax=Yasminevirus sp. GU-2018 TaxID=2420051 RepID=A0A5K0UA01_9VIRU|nr:hypothetical protein YASMINEVIRUS_379 [Yasminevirus sp. GU-2018]
MSTDLTVETLLGSDGFVRFEDDENRSEGGLSKLKAKTEIYEDLHRGDPIKQLREFGMFNDKREIKYDKIEYTGVYNIDYEKGYARYLLSRSYILNKDIVGSIVYIENKEISFACPLYYLSVSDSEGNMMDESLYSVVLVVCDRKAQYNMQFNKGFIQDDNQDFYDIYAKHKNKVYRELINQVKHDRGHVTQYVINDYTDTIIIKFKEGFNKSSVRVECRVYDVYGYGGFFSCGWLFSD